MIHQGELEAMVDEISDQKCEMDPDYCEESSEEPTAFYGSYDYSNSSYYDDDGNDFREHCEAGGDPAKCACYNIDFAGAPGYLYMDCYYSAGVGKLGTHHFDRFLYFDRFTSTTLRRPSLRKF